MHEACIEQHAVGQVGQRVVMGQVLKLLRRLLDAGDVGKHAGIEHGCAVIVVYRAECEPFGVDLAVLATIPDLAAPLATFLQTAPERLVELRRMLPRAEETAGHADDFVVFIAGNLGERAVDLDDLGREVGNHHPFRAAFEYGGRLAQTVVGLALFGDVFLNADEVGGAAAGVLDRPDAHAVPECAAVLAIVAHHGLAAFTLRQGGVDFGDLGLLAIIALQYTAVAPEHFVGAVAGNRFEGRVEVHHGHVAVGTGDDDAVGGG